MSSQNSVHASFHSHLLTASLRSLIGAGDLRIVCRIVAVAHLYSMCGGPKQRARRCTDHLSADKVRGKRISRSCRGIVGSSLATAKPASGSLAGLFFDALADVT